MFENTAKSIKGDMSHETVKASADEFVRFTEHMYRELSEGEGPLTKESVLEAMGPGADELREIWKNYTPDVRYDHKLKLLTDHADAMVETSVAICRLTEGGHKLLARRTGLDTAQSFEELNEKFTVTRLAIESAYKEIGADVSVDRESMARIQQEEPELMKKFIERVVAGIELIHPSRADKVETREMNPGEMEALFPNFTRT